MNHYTFINDDFVLKQQALLPVSDLSVQRGYGIFDFLRTYNNIPLFLDDHLERFFNSADEMRLKINFSKEELKDITGELIQKNKIPDSGIRLTLTGGNSPDGFDIAKSNLIITQSLCEPISTATFEKGYKLISYNHQRQLPQVKTIDYLMAIWLQPVIKEKGADDVLYYKDEVITECPRANIFIVTKDDAIATPKKNILSGVIRKKIISLAEKDHTVEERDITITETKTAKEVFICSTTKQILPVVKIDEEIIDKGEPGAITRKLSASLSKLFV